MAVTLLKNTHKMRTYEQQFHDDFVPTNPYIDVTSPKKPNPFAVAQSMRNSYCEGSQPHMKVSSANNQKA